ncbi:MAG: 7-cyano-7-deazaguanine synthase, partial [Hyphomicrobium sp.]
IDYGQIVAGAEIRAARNIASYLTLRHEILTADLSQLGTGQLAGKGTIREASIPELWPFRNQMLITLAAMKFICTPNLRIIIGTAKGDASHKDGTLEFVEAMNAILQMQEGGATLIAPAINQESIDLLLSSKIDVDILDMKFSCFQADYPCGQCRGCLKNESLRAEYFERRPSCH